jgi:hypothetical protein
MVWWFPIYTYVDGSMTPEVICFIPGPGGWSSAIAFSWSALPRSTTLRRLPAAVSFPRRRSAISGSGRTTIGARIARTPSGWCASITINPTVDLFCTREKREDKFNDAFMEAHDRLNSAFGFRDVSVEETFLRDVTPDWLEDSLITDWFKVHTQRVQLDQAASIQWRKWSTTRGALTDAELAETLWKRSSFGLPKYGLQIVLPSLMLYGPWGFMENE